MELKYKEEKYDIDFSNDGNAYKLNINGENIDLQARKQGENILSVFMDNRYINTYAVEDDSHIYVAFDGKAYTFDKVLEEEKSWGDDNGASADKDVLKPPMPGSIVKVIAAKGQKVQEGDALIIVEAMKMETTMYSSIDGIVTEVNVSEGEQVDADKVLVVVEKEEEG